MLDVTLTVDKQGRVQLPAEWRKRFKVAPSTELHAVETSDGRLLLETREQGLARARAILRKYVPPTVSLVDELIAERREEAEREWRS